MQHSKDPYQPAFLTSLLLQRSSVYLENATRLVPGFRLGMGIFFGKWR
jgi:hypothetical protein